jgi:hypothetical protein
VTDLSQYNQARRQGYVPPAQATQAGLIPAAYQIGQNIVQNYGGRIQEYLNKLFAGYGTTPRQFVTDLGTSLLAPSRTIPGQPPWQPEGIGENIAYGLQNLPGAAYRTGRGLYRNALGLTDESPEEAYNRELGRMERQVSSQLVSDEGTQPVASGPGFHFIRYLMEDGSSRLYRYYWDDKTQHQDLSKQHASHIGQSLRRGERPQVIFESDMEILGLSAENMREMGYYFDEEAGHWVPGLIQEDAPQVAGAALPYGGIGYGTRQRGGGRRGGGGGGGSFSYPQSFVGREQRGLSPQQQRNHAARFGAVTWRI